MPNLRILYDNRVDDATSLVADSTSGTLAAANLLTDAKTQVHRATAKTVRYTAQFASDEVFNMAALAFANFSSTATMRARVYASTADVVGVATPQVDSGLVACCAYAPFGLWPWGMLPLGVNAFTYGGYAYGRVYFDAAVGRKLVIDVADAGNSAAYVEAARLIAGAYWEPEIDANHGWRLAPQSNTSHKRTDAGDLRTEIRPRSRRLSLDLNVITSDSDRARVYDIFRGNGMARPVFLSLHPEDEDPALEQSNQIWGKLDDSAISNPSYGIFAAPLDIQEI